MMPSAAATKESSCSTATKPQQGKDRSGIAPKMIGGIGAVLTLAAVAAVVMSSGPQPSPAPEAQAAPIYSTETPAPSLAKLATIAAPISAAAPVAVADPPSAPAYAVAAAPPAQKECRLPQRKFYVSGNGIIRVHDGIYVSAPVALDAYPREVTFPLSRPEAGVSADETIIVEGNASAVVMTTDLPSFRQVYTRLRGARSFVVHWASLRNC